MLPFDRYLLRLYVAVAIVSAMSGAWAIYARSWLVIILAVANLAFSFVHARNQAEIVWSLERIAELQGEHDRLEGGGDA